jgi:hypothetical protein
VSMLSQTAKLRTRKKEFEEELFAVSSQIAAEYKIHFFSRS